jgi:hypothetical protein
VKQAAVVLAKCSVQTQGVVIRHQLLLSIWAQGAAKLQACLGVFFDEGLTPVQEIQGAKPSSPIALEAIWIIGGLD